MTEPILDILQRDEMQPDVQEQLIKFSKNIEEVVNFGTHILQWEVTQATESEESLPIVLMFRHVLELIDSISILIKQSSIDPCKPILRSILETLFGIEYILEMDTKNRVCGFLVWHYHKELKLAKMMNPAELSYKELERKIQSDKSTSDDIKLPIIPALGTHIANLEKLISLPQYAQAEKEYQKFKNPKWYQLFDGPKNIQQLALRLKREGLYEILYRSWSGPTHGTDIIQGKLHINLEGRAEIIQIRYVKDAQTVTSYAFNLALLTYQIIVNKRIPNKKLELSKWYLTIADFYLKINNGKNILIID